MNCGRVQNRLSAYLDQELGGAEMIAIQDHLSRCADCRDERQSLEQVRRLLGGMAAAAPRPGSQERAFRELAEVAAGRPRTRTTSGASASRVGHLLERLGMADWKLCPPGRRVRGTAWAGAACLGLAAGLAVTSLSQPQHPDAVVAMIRPERELAPVEVALPQPLTDYVAWQRAEPRREWSGNNLALPGRGESPAYRLVGLENE